MAAYLTPDREVAHALPVHAMADLAFSTACDLGHRPAYWTRGRVDGSARVLACRECGAAAEFDEARSVISGPALLKWRCPRRSPRGSLVSIPDAFGEPLAAGEEA